MSFEPIHSYLMQPEIYILKPLHDVTIVSVGFGSLVTYNLEAKNKKSQSDIKLGISFLKPLRSAIS